MAEPEDGPRPVHLLIGGWRPSARFRGTGSLAPAVAAGALLILLVGRVASVLGTGTDFYGRWFGLRHLLLSGKNPYGQEITHALAGQTPFLAPGIDPHSAPTDLETAFGFLYPLPGLLVLSPLALLPYPVALTFWLLAILVMLPAAAWLVVAGVGPRQTVTGAARPPTWTRFLTAPLALLFLPTLAGVFHGQLAPAVAFSVALAAWLSWRRAPRVPWRHGLAGAALVAGVALKPHLLALVAPLWLGYHLYRRPRSRARDYSGAGDARDPWDPWASRSRPFLLGAGLAGAGLAGLAWFLVPTWPADFVHAARAYSALAGAGYPAITRAVLPGGSAVFRLAQALAPGPVAWGAALSLTAGLVIWAARGWRLPSAGDATPGGQGDGTSLHAERRGLSRSLIVSALVLPPAWEANAVVLLIPLAIRLAGLSDRPVLAAGFVVASVSLTALDLPLYATQPWHNGPLLILGYVALLAGTGTLEGGSGLSRRSSPAPGAAAPLVQG